MHRVTENRRTREQGIALCNRLMGAHVSDDNQFDWKLSEGDQHALMSLITDVFGGTSSGPNQLRHPGICAYCERACDNQGPKHADSYNEIDHFRPRHFFNDQTFDWDNLMYVCRRCNLTKKSQFPGKTADYLKQWLGIQGYVEPSDADGYINPRNDDAATFFSFNDYGEIDAKRDEADLSSWSRALRTIYDLKLKDDDLCELRREQFFMVYVALLFASARGERKGRILNDYTRRDSAFSSFIIFARGAGWFEHPPEKLRQSVEAVATKYFPSEQ